MVGCDNFLFFFLSSSCSSEPVLGSRLPESLVKHIGAHCVAGTVATQVRFRFLLPLLLPTDEFQKVVGTTVVTKPEERERETDRLSAGQKATK